MNLYALVQLIPILQIFTHLIGGMNPYVLVQLITILLELTHSLFVALFKRIDELYFCGAYHFLLFLAIPMTAFNFSSQDRFRIHLK